MLAVRCPENAITVCGGTPLRIRGRTPERRRSCTMPPASPTSLHAFAQSLPKSPMRRPLRWKMNGPYRQAVHLGAAVRREAPRLDRERERPAEQDHFLVDRRRGRSREPARVDVPAHAVPGDRDGPRVRPEVVDQVPERVAHRGERPTLLD